MNRQRPIVWRRLAALCRKESYQIIRDPSSIIIAFALPVALLLIYGYGVSFDVTQLRIGVLNEDGGADSADFLATLAASRYLAPRISHSRTELDAALTAGDIRGIVVLQDDFGARLHRSGSSAPVELIADGSEPNTAVFVAAYVQGAWDSWARQRAFDHGTPLAPAIALTARYWFNPAAVSRNFIVPGSIAIIMTIIGALLTSLVVAREWERGTMEALLSTPVTRSELLLSKILPYYLLGMLSMLLCVSIGTWLFGVPFRGSLALLMLYTTLFLGSALGLGLLLSTLTRNQFNAAQAALNAAFLPATMLSGFVYEISSMPVPIQAVTYLIPARYFISALQTLFQAGFVGRILLQDLLFLAASAALFIGLTALKTRRRLD
ncbi:MAG TPA: ABC transporter permease [Steroidobacteraceae bacterium]|nr:ABC transporter permease [Steroidobacteraceae bacterium]